MEQEKAIAELAAADEKAKFEKEAAETQAAYDQMTPDEKAQNDANARIESEKAALDELVKKEEAEA